MKTCTTCNQTKPNHEFGMSTQSKDGRKPRCRVCTREYRKQLELRRDPKYARQEAIETGVKVSTEYIRSLVSTQIKLRQERGDLFEAECYQDVLGWISYFDILNALAIQGGMKRFTQQEANRKGRGWETNAHI